MAGGKRFKFQGSTFSVDTGVGTAKTITGITKANPGVVSSATHGFLEADVVRLAAIVGMTELNAGTYVVDNPAAGTFELAGVDTTGYTTYVSGGTATPLVFSSFCELTGVNQQDGEAGDVEVSTICSTAKEFEIGLSDTGTLSLDFNWAGNEAVQASFYAAKKSGVLKAFRVKFPNSGGTIVLMGYVKSMSFQGAVNGVWTASANIKLTGDMFVTAV